MPGIVVSPNTASNSFFKNNTIFKKDFDIWEFINQYIWGKKKYTNKNWKSVQYNTNWKNLNIRIKRWEQIYNFNKNVLLFIEFNFFSLEIILFNIIYIFVIIKNNEKLNKKNRNIQFIGLIWGIFNC